MVCAGNAKALDDGPLTRLTTLTTADPKLCAANLFNCCSTFFSLCYYHIIARK